MHSAYPVGQPAKGLYRAHDRIARAIGFRQRAGHHTLQNPVTFGTLARRAVDINAQDGENSTVAIGQRHGAEVGAEAACVAAHAFDFGSLDALAVENML